MASEKIDRRVRRTRTLLLQGLIQLMKEKDIKDISVKELSDLVDINRGTFYLHYNDIYDMVGKLEDELFMEFNDILDRNLSEKNRTISHETVLFDIFTFLEKHRALAQVMIGPHGDLAFINRLKELVKTRIQHILDSTDSQQNHEYFYAFIVSGYIGVIENWLNHPAPPSPKEMVGICNSLLPKSLTGQ
ncbi:MAG: TetR/AcrR family transcriptional regulator [Lachnospiraceae bacterium]|nr:TetR/AcrR family transcriptional regulator [Lachnospiraceae bacterium]